MDKCYDGIYAKNVDTLKPKIEFLNKMSGTYMKIVSHVAPKVSEPIRNILELYNILIDNIEKQAEHLQEPIFRS